MVMNGAEGDGISQEKTSEIASVNPLAGVTLEDWSFLTTIPRDRFDTMRPEFDEARELIITGGMHNFLGGLSLITTIKSALGLPERKDLNEPDDGIIIMQAITYIKTVGVGEEFNLEGLMEFLLKARDSLVSKFPSDRRSRVEQSDAKERNDKLKFINEAGDTGVLLTIDEKMFDATHHLEASNLLPGLNTAIKTTKDRSIIRRKSDVSLAIIKGLGFNHDDPNIRQLSKIVEATVEEGIRRSVDTNLKLNDILFPLLHLKRLMEKTTREG